MLLPEQPLVSVVISTYNRVEVLGRTLACLRDQPVDFSWELVVVDNACTDTTQSMLAAMKNQLPLHVLREPRRGKSRAVNLALQRVRGALVILTDDDVSPAPAWLAEYARAFRTFPDAGVFCGPIFPLFPDDTPSWLRSHIYSAESFGRFVPPFDEGYLPPPWLPFGSNFAVRAKALHGMKMREDLGPSEEADLMSEDTEFVKRLRLQSEEFIYVPNAGVGHHVCREQLNFAWLFERAFRLGRSLLIETRAVDMTTAWKHLSEGEAGYFELGVILNYYYGQMYQLCISGDHRKAQLLEEAIRNLPWSGEPSHLARSAVQWLVQDPSRVAPAIRSAFLSSALPV